MNKNSRILIIGHKTLTGNALLRRLENEGVKRILHLPAKADLTNQRAIRSFFTKQKPEFVFLMDVKSGGIFANSAYPAEFIYENLQAQTNIIDSAWRAGVRRLLFIASSCSYPKTCPQPMKEEYLLTGPFEPTNEAFSVAKIAGIKMCQYYNRQYKTDFISVIPATVYGPGDDFEPKTSHVLPAMIRKFHTAKEETSPSVTIWGSGRPRREFLHVDDMVNGCLFFMRRADTPEIINLGTGSDISIRRLAGLLKDISGFKGRLEFDAMKPDGAERKLLDIGKMEKLGFKITVDIASGVKELYNWYAARSGKKVKRRSPLILKDRYS